MRRPHSVERLRSKTPVRKLFPPRGETAGDSVASPATSGQSTQLVPPVSHRTYKSNNEVEKKGTPTKNSEKKLNAKPDANAENDENAPSGYPSENAAADPATDGQQRFLSKVTSSLFGLASSLFSSKAQAPAAPHRQPLSESVSGNRESTREPLGAALDG